jgi:hypothetical protein
MNRRPADWATIRVETARQSMAVPEAVADTLKQHLSARMSERALRPAELSALARELIQAISSLAEKSPES